MTSGGNEVPGGRPGERRSAARTSTGRSVALGAAGVLAALLALPLVAAGRLPERLATHWSGSGGPDGSMPFWAATLGPAALWAALLLSLALTARVLGPSVRRLWYATALPSAGVLLIGAQASIVHANLDRADWTAAGDVGLDVALVLLAAAAAGLLGQLVARRTAAPADTAAGAAAAGPSSGPQLTLPDGERFAWLSRTVNPWLRLTATVSGTAAAALAIAAAAGLADGLWAAVAPLAVVALATLGCSAVQAVVSPKGLEVSFGPFGWPVRRWPLEQIESARAEERTPAQVGGWGYRLSGLGTTVMLRGGPCLVVRPRAGAEFAVSLDDAERGAALLNSLAARRSSTA
ncbi:DUF1648 domain-containing protein [Kitasatospora sp. CM 4170]|uniref:DUF1648 domain-containing protein n=1 Tax=Kitasatospora aburaviensis TaxID=67265 RepID=A0ABW1F214_9ACTN|nr:DUF1648 domain-containing protein [Kitasatospora sp. CM 4170]WNM49041.1 DUF1648 domain-containing protein [Kitasatospora sp. CM 4170]